jgi:tetratricopeptide (TPR) repeat protein
VIEETMFFPRLRKQVKWMFVFLALSFAIGFVFFNIGGAGPGGGIGDLLQNAGAPSGPSVGEAQDRIEEKPNDPQGYRDLATAFQRRGDSDQAIAPLARYVELRPRDVDALQELAALYLRRADVYRAEAEAAQAEAQAALGGSAFDPSPTAITQEVNERLNRAYSKLQENFRLAVGAYLQIARLRPQDANVQSQLAQTAQVAGETEVALAAYRRFLKLAPDDPTAPAVRREIKALERQTAATGGG